MPYFYEEVEVDIEVSDFYDEMSNREKEKMYDYLIKDGYGSPLSQTHEPRNIVEWEFNEIIGKIVSNRLLLTAEEDEMLRKISSRF